MAKLFGIDNGIICQQVNCCGVMGAGLAKAIMDKFPIVKQKFDEQYILSTTDKNKDYNCHYNQLGTYNLICLDNSSLYISW